MGGWLSYFWPPKSAEFDPSPHLDQIDSNTGLTLRQKAVVTEIWAIVRTDIKGNGVDFFLEFFRAHPEYQEKFKGLENLSLEELRSSKKLAAHATNVMHAFSATVDNLDDVDVVVELLMKTGHNHRPRNLSPAHFDNVGIVFINFLRMKLGKDFTPFAQKAWEAAFKVINSIILKGYQQAK